MTLRPRLLLLSAAILAAPLVAQTHHEGAGGGGTIDCDGDTATITGASNRMTVTGGCKALVIEGAGNAVQVDLAPKGTIRITGASNIVTWRTPDGSKPRLVVAGAGNRISRAR